MNRAAMAVAVAVAMVVVTLFAVSADRVDAEGGPDLSGCGNGGTVTFGGVTYTVFNEEGNYSGPIYGDSIIVDMETVDTNTFDQSMEVHTVVFTSKVRKVCEGAFQDNVHIESVETLGKRHISFKSGSFSGCTNLKFIDFRNGVTYELDAFPPECNAMLLLDFEPRINFLSNPRTVVPSNVDGVCMVRYVDSSIQVLYEGGGLLECSYSDGGKSYGTVEVDPTYPGRILTFECNGLNSAIGYKTVPISYGGAYGVADEVAVLSGPTFELASIPEEYGVDFHGWCTAPGELLGTELTCEYVKDNDVGELSLVPSVSFTVSLQTGNLPGIEQSTVPESVECGYGGPYPQCADTEHYAFKGWLVDGRVVPAGTPVEANWPHTATAVWSPKPGCMYTVSYTNCDGSVIRTSEPGGYGTGHVVDGTVPSDVDEDKAFSCWSVSSGGVAYEGSVITLTCDVVLSPVLEERPRHTATFVSLGSVVWTQVAYGGVEMVLDAEDPGFEGGMFLGWSVDGRDGLLHRGDGILLDGDAEFVAAWEYLVFTVTYVSCGRTVGAATATYGETVTVHADASWRHHTLAGWSDGAEVLEDRSGYTVRSDTVFEAVWTEDARFTVTLHCGGASGTASGYVGESVALPGCPAGGHETDGWALSEGGPVEYAAGSRVSPAGDLDLYCVPSAPEGESPSEPAQGEEDDDEYGPGEDPGETPGGGSGGGAPPSQGGRPSGRSLRAEATVLAVGTAVALAALMALLVAKRS